MHWQYGLELASGKWLLTLMYVTTSTYSGQVSMQSTFSKVRSAGGWGEGVRKDHLHARFTIVGMYEAKGQ